MKIEIYKKNKTEIKFINLFDPNSIISVKLNPPLEIEENTLQFSGSGPEQPKDPHKILQI
jgi:hypothetical protein